MLALVLSACCVSANSAVRYSYVGPDFRGAGYQTALLPDGLTRIEGYFVLDVPLEANLTHATLNPVEYSFTDGLVTLDGSDPDYIALFMSFDTDADGNITKWWVNIKRDYDLDASSIGTPEERHVYLESYGNIGLDSNYADFAAYSSILNGSERVQALAWTTEEPSGVWTATVPIPAAAWLFGSALGILGWMRRGRS